MNAQDVLVSLGGVVLLWICAEGAVRGFYEARQWWRTWKVGQELKAVQRQRLEHLRDRQRERQAWISTWGDDY